LWDFLDQLLDACGQGPVPRAPTVPYRLAYGAGYLFEKAFQMFGVYHREPPMTRFLAMQLSHSHYFLHREARDGFGYNPSVTVPEGLRRLKLSFTSQTLH